jgi:hypothetical protein
MASATTAAPSGGIASTGTAKLLQSSGASKPIGQRAFEDKDKPKEVRLSNLTAAKCESCPILFFSLTECSLWEVQLSAMPFARP